MQQIHHILRKFLPFLYERNWYNGQFEFKRERAIVFVSVVAVLIIVVGFALWMGKPIEYTQSR